jgi:hypothetical protein
VTSVPALENVCIRSATRCARLVLLPAIGRWFPAQKFGDPITAFPPRLVAVARKPPASQLKADHVGRGADTAADSSVLANRSFHGCHVYHLCLWSEKFDNSEPKMEFQLHSYERTDVLRKVARGVPEIAWTWVDVPANGCGTGHLREDSHGLARGAWAPAPSTGKTPEKTEKVSIKEGRIVRENDFAGGTGD